MSTCILRLKRSEKFSDVDLKAKELRYFRE
jgi:hypothetical protein